MGRLAVGDTLNSYLAEKVPVGTVMKSGAYDYQVTGDRMWERVSNRQYRYGVGDFTWANCAVVSFPAGMEYLETPRETLAQYKWRFRDHALAAAVANGVNYSASDRALQDMGAGADQFPLGAEVRIKNPQFLQNVPTGTVVYRGTPGDVNGFSVWVKNRGGSWNRLLGNPNHRSPRDMVAPVTIHQYQGSHAAPEWATVEGTDEDESLIAEFKATAWSRGYQLKREQSWCGTYENVMNQFGLTRESVRRNGHVTGTRVSAEGAAALPEGTFLGWQSSNNPAERVLFVRTNTVSNVARTVKVDGTDGSSDRNYHSSMVVVSIPDAGRGWAECRAEMPVSSPWVHLLPIGTTFTNSENAQFQYTPEPRNADGILGARQISDTPGYRRWDISAFGEGGMLFINNIGGVTL